jgi:ABC-type transport system involved in multi-copper enzyme maturation permease subunit
MKFLAILKDSFYETKDFKLFYILLGISVLFTVAAASFRFPRLPVEEALNNNVGGDLRVRDVQPIEESFFTPHARYRFRLEPRKEGELVQRLTATAKKSILEYEGQRFEQRRILGLEEVKFDSSDMFANPQAIFERINKARESSANRKLNELLGEDHETAAKNPQRLAEALFKVMPGTRNATVHASSPDAAFVEVETDVNWAELPHSRKVGLLFGIWQFDLGRLTVGQFMTSFVHTPLIRYLAGWVGIVIAVIITAGFVPGMMQKGTVDLLLVKPISRAMLLIYKYLGGLCFVLLNAAVLVLGTWIAFGFSTGNWSPWYLASVPVLTFYFAILYAMSMLIGVLTRSPLAAVLITIGVWAFLGVVSYAYQEIHRPVAEKFLEKEMPAVLTTVDSIHLVLPKPGDLDTLNKFLILRANGAEEMLEMQRQAESKFDWNETLLTSGAFIAVMLGLACWRFSRRDY